MADLDRENARLNELLADLHVSVSERRNIRDTHIQPRVSAKIYSFFVTIRAVTHKMLYRGVPL